MKTVKQNTAFKTIKLVTFSFVLGAILAAGATAYMFKQTYPKQIANPQVLTEAQVWVEQHPQETQWAIQRYNKFHIAADKAFLEEDVATIEASK